MKKKPHLTAIGVLLGIIVLFFAVMYIGSVLEDNPLHDCVLKEDGTYCYVGYSQDIPEDGVLVIPAEYKGVPITEVCYYLGNDDIREIVISEGITTISAYGLQGVAFSEFNGLEKITLPSTLQSIAPIGQNVEIVFTSNDYLEFENNCILDKATGDLLAVGANYEIPAGVEVIREYACCGVTSESFYLPASVTVIEDYAFSGVFVDFGEHGKRIYQRGLELDELVLPANVKVGNWVFNGGKIDTLVVGSKDIEAEAFINCNVRQVVFDVITDELLVFDGQSLKFVYDKIGLPRPEDEQIDPEKEVESDRPGYRKYSH